MILWARCRRRSSSACARSTSPRASGCSLRGSRKLDIPRERAAALGHEALAIVHAGEYVTRSGRRTSIAALVDAAKDGTVEYGPDDPVPAAGADAPARRVSRW